MTLADLRILVAAYCETAGESYLTYNEDILVVINRVMKQYARDTLCLYSDNIVWTLTPDVKNYSLRDSAVFSRLICQPFKVWINGVLLLRSTTSANMADIPGYMEAASSTPTVWYSQPPNHICLYPAPSAVFANNRVAGWYMPDDLVEETDVLEFKDECFESLAVDVAIALLSPRATGDLLERVQFLKQSNAEEKKIIRQEAETLLSPIRARKTRNRNIFIG